MPPFFSDTVYKKSNFFSKKELERFYIFRFRNTETRGREKLLFCEKMWGLDGEAPVQKREIGLITLSFPHYPQLFPQMLFV